MRNGLPCAVALAGMVAACATVNPADTNAWIGQPVNVLDKQPLFLSMQVVRTQAADGTEIRNYIDSRNISTCSGSGTMFGFGRRMGFGAFNDFSTCMQSVAACNNIFYIVDGRVQRLVLMGTGGMRCSTDRRFLPDFTGPTGDQ